MDELEAEMRQSSRFPYTYAADWVRMAGLAESRAEASQWRQRAAEEMGKDDAALAEELALEYIAHYVTEEKMRKDAEAKFARLVALPSPPNCNRS